MKPRDSKARSLNISNSRWMRYAAAGLATASGAAAEGAIHYTDPANVRLRGDDRATFPLDDLGVSLVFQHLGVAQYPPVFWWAGFSIVGGLSASVRGHRIGGTFSLLSNLNWGSLISQGYLRPGGFGTLAFYFSGEFDQPGIGLIGFAFNNGSGRQYGWARVRMTGIQHRNFFKVLDYGYADPGEPIEAGQTSDEPVTGMGSLGLLAAGAVGLLSWRKSRDRHNSALP